MVTAVGGTLFQVKTPLEIGGKPVVWFNRDREGQLLLNFEMPASSGEPRAVLVNNDWLVRGELMDLFASPLGRKLVVKFAGGDSLSIEFSEALSAASLAKRCRARGMSVSTLPSALQFPITLCEISLTVAEAGISVSPSAISVPGFSFIGGLFQHADGFGGIGLSL
ncbi:MAG TPA: hypothetical protein VFE05_10790 [Longimicrobiaceae bacterium]|jgi:hypothetical protein|nr:hypothetical protein [Longimicrobiaceae bacterium]